MGAVVKTMMLVALAVVPGGFVALFAYVAGRALIHSWHRAAASPGSRGRTLRNGDVIRATFSGLSVRNLAREARAVLAT